MSPCEVCHSKWERLFINLKLLFHLLQMKFFPRTFYLQSTSRLLYYFSETTTSLTYTKKLFHIFFSQTHWSTCCHRTQLAQTARPITHQRCLCYVEDPVLSRTGHPASLDSHETKQLSFLGWKTSSESIPTVLQIHCSTHTHTKVLFQVKSKDKWQSDKVFRGFSCTLCSEADLKWGSKRRSESLYQWLP